ncbi:MAG: DNA polymerase III subunit gamma/tau [candidate division WOR-3 bacterium]|nr:MAG: DNA polymerase III subunit gamma/tau [candidate division WOR-3 bacterium]
MSNQVLTLKYRPQTFDELLVQEHVSDTLSKAIENQRFANAYLFAGPRGVGKTTTARILAKSLNCLSYNAPTTTPCNKCSACLEIAASRSMDVLEIDGASNRGIDQIRELRENIKYAPSSLRYKVYIIDEVHMLTEPAFNALLKTLEEPPAHARFVFATTEAHKVPTTILSRCQRFDFRRATSSEIADRLRWIAGKEKIKASDDALVAVARRAEGAIRDGESILEQLATYRPEGIEVKDVEELLGIVPAELFVDYVDLLIKGDIAGLLRFADRLFERGFDLVEFHSGLVSHLRNILLVQAGGPVDRLGLLPAERKKLKEQASAVARAALMQSLEAVLKAEESAKRSRLQRVVFEYLSLDLAARLSGAGAPAAPEPRASHSPRSRPKPKKTEDSGLEDIRDVFGDIEEN